VKDKLSILIILLLIGSSYSAISLNSQELSFENSPKNFSFNSSNWTLSPTNGSHHGGTHLTINGDGFSSFFETQKINPWYQGNFSTELHTIDGGWSQSHDVGTHSSMAIDSQGNLHISHFDFINADLLYTTFDGISWTNSIIDSSGSVGQYSSIAIDSNDNIHISYYNYDDGSLKYANSNNGNSFGTSTVEMGGSIGAGVGQYTSIAVDSNNKIHISYWDVGNGQLKYANCIQSSGACQSWVTTVVDNSLDSGKHTSIAVDSNDNIHISYYQGDATDILKYAHFNGFSWTTSTIDSYLVGHWTSIATDSNNGVHISYYDIANGNLKYMKNNGNSWSIPEIIDSVGDVGRMTSINVDSNDFVHISYLDVTNQDLKYATSDGFNWTTSTIDNVGNVGWYSSLVFDSDENIHISYHDQTNGDLKYAKLETMGWILPTFPSGSGEDQSSMAIDSNDNIHISYYSTIYNDLGHAKYDGQSWSFTNVDDVGNVGLYSSLKIDSNDNIHIAYTESGNCNNLKYAKYDGISWTTTILECDAKYPSLAIDSNDVVHIAYCKNSCDDLYYGTYDTSLFPNPTWTSSMVVNTGTVECRTSISLDIDSNDIPHIIYHEYNDQELKHASKNGWAWVTSTIDSFGFGIDPMQSQFGCHNSLDIDSNDNLHVSYTNYNIDFGSLKYATYDGNSWTKTVIESMDTPTDSMPYSYADTSILLDFNGQVHISYHNLQLGELKYVTNDGNYWINSTIDDGSSIDLITDRDDDGHSSLALDSYGNLYASYVDESYGIRYAKSLFQLELINPWETFIVPGGTNNNRGKYSSIALDSNDNVHISFEDQGTSGLEYANYNGNSWTFTTLGSGTHNSIAVDSNDNIHISYFQNTNKNLMYIYYDDFIGTWSQPTVVDSGPDAGYYNSIAIDSNDNIHISYQQQNATNTLKHAFYDGVSWTKTDVDPFAVGGFTAIAIDSNDNIHISHQGYGTPEVLRHSYFDGISWSNHNIDSGPDCPCGSYTSLDIDSNDGVHVSYSTYGGTDDLKHAYYDGISWITSIVDSQGSVGRHSSLKVDSLNNIHISYEDNTEQDLKYAYFDGNAWSNSTLDDTPAGASYTSLATDSKDDVHISYHEGTYYDLKYAKMISLPENTLGDLTIEFGNYGNITGTVVDDTTITFVSPPGPQSGAVVSNIKIWLENGTNISMPFSFTYDAYDSDGDGIPDNNDDCPYIFGNSTFDLIGCIDSDGDGVSDSGDAFPLDPFEATDSDSDGVGDNSDMFPEDETQWSDFDGDVYGDNISGNNPDYFPYEPTQWNDTDGDGYGDNLFGYNHDACPEVWGNSTITNLGCPDADGDGLADMDDDFPYDPIRGGDSDLDGYDDVIDDDCPEEFGTSNMNLTGCPDSDGDGWADSEDDFPSDFTRNRDSDLDGYDDNLEDDCPDTWGTSNMNLVGCIDTDGDGLADIEDDFPLDASEIIDSDNDGFGNNEDRFPTDPNEWIDSDNDTYGDNRDELPFDETQWNDTDGDGYGDNQNGNNPDLFVNNITQWDDSDGDGYGDNWGNSSWNSTRLFVWPGQFIEDTVLADHCPTEFGTSTADGFFGCPDEDGDGIADIYDSPDEEEPVVNDEDGDGISDDLDLCPETPPEEVELVNELGCIDTDSDGDGVVDKFDLCNDTPQGEEVNVEGCTIINSDSNEESENYMQQLLSGDQETVVTTVGIGAVVIALIGFLQSNLLAAFLPDTLRGLQVLRKKSKLTREETQELTYLQSVLRAYHDEEEIFEEELKSYKSEITAKYTNNEIKKATLEKINLLISDLLTMDSSELERIANDESYFGLMGTTKIKQRKSNLSKNIAMKDTKNEKISNLDDNVYNKNNPPDSISGEINENDGYEYIQWPKNSGRWFIKNKRTKQWEEWKD
tara:strand:+ start:197 stop:5857 length:5661 start_codon:yes stop_codon:yes gene_type:complete